MCVNSSNFVSHSISDVKMDVAVPQPTGNERAMEVEECACPQGYRGPSCQVRKKKNFLHGQDESVCYVEFLLLTRSWESAQVRKT